MTPDQSQHLIIADGHVHLHACFDIGELLSSALANFKAIAKQKGLSSNFSPALLLTEIGNHDCFSKCWNYSKENNNSNLSVGKEKWEFYKTKEAISLQAINQDGQDVFLIAGRQIVTEEGLEVLALVTNETFADRLPLDQTVKLILSTGGIPVMPWGVGKWIGKRGKTLKDYLNKNRNLVIFLGDNSGRPIFWPFPSTSYLAPSERFAILPGTDPLPLSSEVWRPGSFGFTVEGSLNADEPGQQIKRSIFESASSIQPYGTLESPLRFFRNQFLIRYRKQGL